MSTIIGTANTVYRRTGAGVLGIRAGWTGLENCGNLLTYKMDVGYDGGTLYGYIHDNDANTIGGLYPDIINGQTIYWVTVDSGTDVSHVRFGAAGNEQLGTSNTIDLTFQGFANNPVNYTWTGGSNLYQITANDPALTAYLVGLNGQRTSFELSTVVLLDTFTDAPGTFIEDHPLDTGQSWQTFTLRGAQIPNSITIQGNQLRVDASEQVIVADPLSNNVHISVDWTPQAESRQGVIIRLQGDGEGLTLRMRNSTQDDLELVNRTDFNEGTVHATTPFAWVDGQTYAIDVTVFNDLITVLVDSVQIFRVKVTDYNTSRLTGIGSYTSDGLGLFDNFKVLA